MTAQRYTKPLVVGMYVISVTQKVLGFSCRNCRFRRFWYLYAVFLWYVYALRRRITDEMPYAIVHQDSLIKQLMSDKRSGYTRGEQLMDGFRVQIYASNQQQLAKQEATELQQRIEPLIDIPIYTISEPPFWKVRIGNFTTREDANEYKNTFLQLFPELTGSTYIVPDKIIIIR